MARKAPRFVIGLFVTIGILLAAVVIIWLGVSRYFEKGGLYVTYFDESVQGLQRDSSVKYRGVAIGRIESIAVAPDSVLIEVVMKLELEDDWEKKATAQLKPAGITGIVFVDLAPRKPGEPDLSPKITFTPRYPVIPSRPSEIGMLIESVERAVGQIQKLDVEKAVSRVEAAAGAAENLMSRPEIGRVLKNLDALTAHLDSAAARVDRIMEKGDVEGILSDTRDVLRDSKDLVKKLKEEVQAVNLAETAHRVDRMVDNLDRKARVITEEIVATSESLHRASGDLEILMERLKANPSDLLFSRPPPPGRE